MLTNLDKSTNLITLSAQVPVTPTKRQVVVSDKAIAVFAYNLDRGDTVYPVLILAPPDEVCVGKFPMQPIVCNCRTELYFKETGEINNVMVLDVPGRYDLYYQGARQDDLVIFTEALPRDADAASLMKSCC